ncbi:MAG: formate/nitrite transporter family protein [Clostridia bacterium]|jgi:formate/nitrite transporter|nr:formate/nitrite transporter family protein [Clostridia bacterium]MCI1999784.1 formate/nitrite transporter family protein [Clostridia bacterium]MCI2014300.1 formate/nitrite transporter family protein [Clostridia bacterium]
MNSPKEIAQNYIAIGTEKTKISAGRMLWLGILAGMFIALAGVTSTIASATLEGSVAKIIGAILFPGGLAMVLIAGSELFTGNTLIIIPVLEKKVTVGSMLKNWVIVYIGNFLGSLLVSALLVYGNTFLKVLPNGVAGVAAIHTAVVKVNLPFSVAFIRGILCNFLVCIAVWMSFAAKDTAGKIIGLFFPIMIFVLCGFEHSVANMYFISAGLFANGTGAFADAIAKLHPSDNLTSLTWSAFIIKNLIPVTLGNIVGGSVLVGLGYWFTYIHKSEKQNS